MPNVQRLLKPYLLAAGLLLPCIAAHGDGVTLPVYKGQLQVTVPDPDARDSLRLRYRSRTRDVLRIGVSGLQLTGKESRRTTRIPGRGASLVDGIDEDGYWVTDILYRDVDLGETRYRLRGRLTQYLIGSQRSRDFTLYFSPDR